MSSPPTLPPSSPPPTTTQQQTQLRSIPIPISTQTQQSQEEKQLHRASYTSLTSHINNTNTTTNTPPKHSDTIIDTPILQNLTSSVAGDITYDLYKWHEDNQPPPEKKRRASLPTIQTPKDPKDEHLFLPNGYRRRFIIDRREQNQQMSHKNTRKRARVVTPTSNHKWTNSFLHFLALYGDLYKDHSYVVSAFGYDDSSDTEEGDVKSLSKLSRRDSTFGSLTDEPIVERLQLGTKVIPVAKAGAEEGMYVKVVNADGKEMIGTMDQHDVPSSHGIPDVQLNGEAKTFFMLIKAFVGTGILFLPGAYKNGGMAFSSILLVFMGIVTNIGMLVLMATKNVVGGARFGDIGKLAIDRYCGRFGSSTRVAIEVCLAISQIGFCAAYCVFIAQTLQSVVHQFAGHTYPLSLFVFPQMLLYLPASLVRKVSKFSPLAIAADIFIIIGLATVIAYDIIENTNKNPAKLPVQLIQFNTEKYPLFIGTVVFAFEGIGLIIPIEQAMRRPQRFPWVLSLVMLVTGALMLLIAALTYGTFGERTHDIVFQTFAPTKFNASVQILYAVALIFSFPMVLYPGTTIIEERIMRGQPSGKIKNGVKWFKNGIRFVCVTATAVIAWSAGDNLENFVSIVGSLCCGPLLFIFPAMVHFTVAKSTLAKVGDILLGIFGLVITIYCTYLGAAEWAKKGSHEH